MNWPMFNKVAAELFYCIIALIFILVGLNAKRTVADRFKGTTTMLFWFVLAFTFAVGPHLPPLVTGLCVVFMALLTGIKGVRPGTFVTASDEQRRASADRLGYRIFLPALALALSAVAFSMIFKSMKGDVVLGLSGLTGLVVAFWVTRATPAVACKEAVRLMDSVGTTGILPQLLSSLGAVFTVAGVGQVIASGVGAVIPSGNLFLACAAYCLGMALFTVIMGNGFAAFSVITVGIGIPFLISQGANPAIVGALGLTAGYCGTLCTPMAANFNIMPAALLETRSDYSIIKTQIPYALVMLALHILLMYFLAFRF